MTRPRPLIRRRASGHIIPERPEPPPSPEPPTQTTPTYLMCGLAGTHTERTALSRDQAPRTTTIPALATASALRTNVVGPSSSSTGRPPTRQSEHGTPRPLATAAALKCGTAHGYRRTGPSHVIAGRESLGPGETR